jgi:hypothetical protein
MEKYSLPYFGELDPGNLEEYYDVDINFNGQEISIDLNLGNSKIAVERFDLVKRFLENIEAFDKNNKIFIAQDYDDEGSDTVRTYVEHHLEEMDETDLSGLVDFKSDAIAPEKQLINSLKLVRVGLYPDENENQFAVFDYSIGKDLTDDLVVLLTDQQGHIDHITMES